MKLSAVIAIMIHPEALISRITARRTCATCGTIVNLALNPLEHTTECPNCGGELTHREDDNEVVVRRRIEAYHNQTEPLMAYYQSRNLLFPVEGMGSVAEVQQRISSVLESIGGGPACAADGSRNPTGLGA